MSLQKQISIHIHSLTFMEKELLRNLLDNFESFEYRHFTIENIADRFNVSKTSVHRFTKKLGYDSFTYFKDDFFGRVVQDEVFAYTRIPYVDMLTHTYELATKTITDDIVKKMINSKRITIYGMGMSNFLGKMFQIKLQLYGKTAEQYDDSRFMRLSARALVPKEDVLFVLSRSGRPPEIVEAVVEASLRKIDIILITEVPDSPIGMMATHIIQTSQSKDLDNDIDTRLNAHIAMDLLMARFIEFREKEEVSNEEKY